MHHTPFRSSRRRGFIRSIDQGMADKPEQQGESLDTSSQAKVILKDPFVGNVSKLVPLPVDHKGPPMRGHLLFDACFEGGGANSLPG